jgi:hypothetical protein
MGYFMEGFRDPNKAQRVKRAMPLDPYQLRHQKVMQGLDAKGYCIEASQDSWRNSATWLPMEGQEDAEYVNYSAGESASNMERLIQVKKEPSLKVKPRKVAMQAAPASQDKMSALLAKFGK